MKKAIVQGIVVVILFLSTWLMLGQVNWMSVFQVEKTTKSIEEKLGEICWNAFRSTGKENNNQSVKNALDSLVTKICVANKIERQKIKIHVLDKDEVNAFALPNGHLVVYSGLISIIDNQEALSGIIGHELAHIELNHVMKKMIKEFGLSTLISLSTGNAGTKGLNEIMKTLSSTAVDRNLEQEADIKAVDYLVNTDINPGPLADFLYKLAEDEDDATKYLSWISTHPDSKERAENIIQYSKNKTIKNKPILSQQTWDQLKLLVKK